MILCGALNSDGASTGHPEEQISPESRIAKTLNWGKYFPCGVETVFEMQFPELGLHAETTSESFGRITKRRKASNPLITMLLFDQVATLRPMGSLLREFPASHACVTFRIAR